MRRILALLTGAALLLSLASCSLPFRDEPEQESSSAEHTFVITTYAHLGLEKMMDGVNWYDNTICAVQYLGTRAEYTKKIETLRQRYFPQIDAESMQDISVLDASGNDAFLLVPRFDLTRFSVFSVAVDAEEKVHVLRQVGETDRAFVLLCDAGSNPNAQINAILKTRDTSQTFKMLVQRSEAGSVQNSNGFQPLEPK